MKKRFVKKPVVIEAYQTDKEMTIQTLEGPMHASVGEPMRKFHKTPQLPTIYKYY